MLRVEPKPGRIAVKPASTPGAAPILQRQCACETHTMAGSKCDACADSNRKLQRHASHASEAGSVPPIVHDALRSSGQPLDATTRAYMEPRFGHDFSRVRVHTGSEARESARILNAAAYTSRHDIVFAAEQYAPRSGPGKKLLAHELTHVLQQDAGLSGRPDQSGDDGILEREADLSARLLSVPTVTGRPSFSPRAAGSRLQLKKAAPPPTPEEKFALILTAGLAGMTVVEARKALDIYKALSGAERQKAFEKFYPGGNITSLLRAVTAEDAASRYRNEIGELLRWVEEAETRKTSGLTDDKMAEVQAKFKIAEATKEAQAKLDAKAPKDAPRPKASAKDIEDARKEQVHKTSIAPTLVTKWDKMPKADQDKWVKRGEAVVKKLVDLAAKSHPELKLAERDFLADFADVEGRGRGVLAQGKPKVGGGSLAAFGFAFVEAAEANPAYVMSVVVHEIFGHPEYGKYGTEYHLNLFDKAQAKIPGYTKPATGTKERTAEIDAYAYQETEIYSLLRSLPYHTPLAAADKGKGLVSIDPASTVAARLGIMKRQWEPKLAVAIVRGLYQRLLQDPRITASAINAFRAGVKTNFPAEEKDILK